MKRILCTLLVLSMLLSAMPAFANDYYKDYEYMDHIFRFDVGDFTADSSEDTVTDGVDKEQEIINFLDLLGIWDDAEKNKNTHLTQSEFAVIMSRVRLGVDNPLQEVYLANPDDTKVTYKDVYKQLITALGYYYMCERYENPEDWILFVADEIDLLVSIPENMSEYITRAEFAKIVYKALSINLSVIEYTDNGYRHEVSETKTLLSSIHNLYDVSGFVNAVYGLSVYGGNTCRQGYIQINRRNIKISGLDLSNYLGRVVKAYASYDEAREEYNLVHIDYETDAKYVEIAFEDIYDISNKVIYYLDENGNEAEIDVANLETVVENGQSLNSIDEMSSFEENEGKIILTSSEKYGDIDTAIIYKYTYALVESNDTLVNQIRFKNKQKYDDVNTYVTVDERAVKKVTLDGEAIDISVLPAGVTVKLFKNESTGYMEIVATNEKLIGQITSIDGDYYAIDDNWYRISKDFKKVISDPEAKINPLELGLTTTFYVLDGIIAGYEKASEYKYGYLKSVTQARTGIDPDLTLKIFSQDGEWLELKVTKPIELDGEKNIEKSEIYEFLKNDAVKEGRNNENMAIDNIIRFKANGDTLAALDTVTESRFETDSDEDMKFNTFNTYDGNWTQGWLANGYSYRITEKTVVFAIPKDRNEEDLYAMSNNVGIQDIAGNGTMDSYFFNTNDLCVVGAVLIDGTISEIKGNADSGGANYYITKIMNAVIDAENEEYGYKVEAERIGTGTAVGVAYKTTKSSFYVSKELFERNPLNVGDFVSVNTSGGKATSWTVRLPGGCIPTEFYYNDLRLSGIYEAVGRISALDASTDEAVIDVGEVYDENGTRLTQLHPVVCRAKLIINPDTNKLESTTLSSFHVGDVVYIRPQYGFTVIIKNVFSQ